MENSIGINKILGVLAHAGVYIGINCFVLVSAYFLSMKFSIKRIVKIEAQVLSYSILAFFLVFFCSKDQITAKMLIKVFLPTIFKEYWFVTAYIGEMMFCGSFISIF